jgi:hypothetical protein
MEGYGRGESLDDDYDDHDEEEGEELINHV